MDIMGPKQWDGAQRGDRIGYPISLLLGMPPTLLRIRTHPAAPASCKGGDDVSNIQPLTVRRTAYEGVLCSVEQEQDDSRGAAPHLLTHHRRSASLPVDRGDQKEK